MLCQEISALPAAEKLLGMVFSRSEMALRYLCTQILPPPLKLCIEILPPPSNSEKKGTERVPLTEIL